MTIKRVSSIDEIYHVAKEYDVVITREAPLADALNNRIERARFDKLVYTPRGLVYAEDTDADTKDRRELFLKIIKKTDLSWKRALSLLENVLDCWQETGRLKDVFNYDQLNVPDVRDVVEILQNTESVFRLMEQYEWGNNKDTLVLDPPHFKPLDRKVLPREFDSLFLKDEESEFRMSPLKIYPSASNLVESMLNQITPDNASDVAIVLESSSPYQYLVRSALQAREIPFISTQNLTENRHFRTLFTLMRCALGSSRLKVEDVQPVIKMTDHRVSIQDNEKYLNKIDGNILDVFRELVEDLRSRTFKEAVGEYRELLDWEDTPDDCLQVLERTLNEINIAHQRISESNLNRLEFYLNSFDVQVEKQNQGVLLASPKSEAFVDRPVLFYVGMDVSWTRHVPDKPWVNQDQHRKRNVNDFESLLQNGDQRFYLVQEKRFNEDVTPCFYFNVLFDDSIETFTDFEYERMSGRPEKEFKPGSSFEVHSVDAPEPEAVETISQSSLNKLTRCPREYLLSKLIPDPENLYMKKGNIFHDYAEFFVSHPELLSETDEQEIIDVMVEALRPFLDEWQIDEARTEFQVGMDNIHKFIEKRAPNGPFMEEYSTWESDNIFSKHFDRPVESPMTEAWFENKDLGARGKIDLIRSPTELVDYKSGARESARSIIRESNVELLQDNHNPNFQAIMYLTQHRNLCPNEPLKFTFFYFLDNLTDRLQGRGSVDDTLVTVTYYPRTFSQQVPRDETLDYLRTSKARRKLLDKLGEGNFIKIFKQHEIDVALDRDDLLDSNLADEFVSFARNQIGDFKYVKDGCENVLKRLSKMRTENYFKEDLDRFESFLADQINCLEEYLETGFPVEGMLEKFDLEDANRRDLILDDSG